MAFTGGEHLLDTGLGVVEVAPDGADLYIVAGLGGHLRLLDGGHAAVGVEHDDAGTLHVVEALQRGLAGVAGGGGEDDHVALHAFGLGRCADEAGQHRQGHILKGGGGAVVQLQHILISHRHQRCQVGGGELAVIAAADDILHIGEVRQQRRENFRGHGQRIQPQRALPVEVQLGRIADVQTAVGGDALQHRPGRGGGEAEVACAMVQHRKSPPKNYSCISNDAMIHCRQQKSKCFYTVDK